MKQRKKLPVTGFSFFFLLCTLVPHSLSSQEKREQDALQEEVTVTLKLIQVYVTDKKGNPVTNLKKEDFSIKDSGKAKKITEFERHLLSLPSDRALTHEDTVRPRLSRKFFLFFDFAFNHLGGIDMAKRAALHFIDTQVQPTDALGVVSFSSEKGLVLHEYLTTDHGKIRELIQDIGFKEVLGRAGRFLEELEGVVHRTGDPASQALAAAAQEKFMSIAGIEQLKYQAKAYSLAIRDWAISLRYIPGYKHIILFSLGIPNHVIYPTAPTVSPRLDTFNKSLSDSTALRTDYSKTYRELTAANCPVFTVNVEGVHSGDMDKGWKEDMNKVIRQSNQPTLGIGRLDRRGGNSLLELATNSGGKYFENVNDYKRIVEEIQTMTGSYYVLGYYIDEKWDGKYHKIEVDVRRKGCRVYNQRGFFNPKPFKKYSTLERKLHLIDLALSERPYIRSHATFPMMALSREIGNRSYALLCFQASGGSLNHVLGERNEIVFLAFDEQRNIIGFKGREIDNMKLGQQDNFIYTIFPLYPGRFEGRVVVRNLETGRAAVGSVSVVIPDTTHKILHLHSPLVLTKKTEVQYVPADQEGLIEGKEYENLVRIYPFDPDQYSPLGEQVESGASEMLILVPYSVSGISDEWIKLFASCVNRATGEKVPVIFSYEKAGGMFALNVMAESWEPGTYYVYIFAEEFTTQTKAHTRTIFTVAE